MEQELHIFFDIGEYGLLVSVLLALARWVYGAVREHKSIWKLDPHRVIFVGLVLLGVLLFHVYEKLKLSQGMYYHAMGLICWIAAIIISYRVYCNYSRIDTDPVVYIRLMIIPFFVGLCFLLWPCVQNSSRLMHTNWAQNLLQSAHYAWRTFTLENSFEEVWTAAKLLEGITTSDRTYIAVLVTAAPLLTFTVALSFFTVPVFVMKIVITRFFFWNRKIYLYSELSDRSIRYAEALQKAFEEKGQLIRKPLIAFCAAKEKEKDTGISLNALNATVLHRSIDHLHFIWLAPKKRLRFYLISDDENLNIQQAKELHERYGLKCCIRCVSSGQGNEAKIDEMNAVTGNNDELKAKATGMKAVFTIGTNDLYRVELNETAQELRNAGIEAINEAGRALYTELYQRPLLSAGLLKKLMENSVNGSAAVSILIFGGGRIGSELARICLWYCQLPGITVDVTVVDKLPKENLQASILKNCPDFQEDIVRVFGNAVPAVLNCVGDTDAATFEWMQEKRGNALLNKQYHIIFICMGNDDSNYQLAIQLRRYYLRREPEWGCPEIKAVIWNDTMAKLVDPKEHKALAGYGENPKSGMNYHLKNGQEGRYNEACRVDIFGNMSESVWNINQLWFDALRYNAFYSLAPLKMLLVPDDRKLILSGQYVFDFCTGLERFRRSSMAAAIHGKCKEAWLQATGKEIKYNPQDPDPTVQALAEAEHRRWCVYELLEGSSPVPDNKEYEYYKIKGAGNEKGKDKDTVRGYHAVLRSWSSLQAMAEKKTEEEAHQIQWEEWKKAYENNMNLVRFSHRLEQSRGGFAEVGGKGKEHS